MKAIIFFLSVFIYWCNSSAKETELRGKAKHNNIFMTKHTSHWIHCRFLAARRKKTKQTLTDWFWVQAFRFSFHLNMFSFVALACRFHFNVLFAWCDLFCRQRAVSGWLVTGFTSFLLIFWFCEFNQWNDTSLVVSIADF